MAENVEFTEEELEELAEFVCGRVESLTDMLINNKQMPESTIKGIRKAVADLASLDKKLRPYYRGRS